MASERQRLKVLNALTQQGERVGYGKRPEVQQYPVLGALGALNPEQFRTMAFHLDRMGADERERVVSALMDFGSLENGSVTPTLAGMPSGSDAPPDPVRFPYLHRHAFRRGTPRYRGEDE